MQLTACSIQFSRLGDPLMSLDLLASSDAAQLATTIAVYNRKSFGLQTKVGDAPLPKRGTPIAQEFDRFLHQLLSAVEAIRMEIGTDRDFHGKAASSFDDSPLKFRYSVGPPSMETPNQPVWSEAWTRTPRKDFPQTILVGECKESFQFRAGEMLAELRKKYNSRDSLRTTNVHEESLETTDSEISDSYRVCFCFRVAAQTGKLRALCWLHPDWPDQRLARTGPHHSMWLRSRMRKAAANNYLCVFEDLVGCSGGSGGCGTDQRALAETVLMAADGKGEDCPLFYLAVESHSFTVADWLLESRKRLRHREQDESREVPVIDAYNRWGDTALTWCCGRGGDSQSIAYLLSRGSDRLNQHDFAGNTALHRLAASIPSTAKCQTMVQSVLNALLSGLSVKQLVDWLAKENRTGERAMALVSNADMLDTLFEAIGVTTAGTQPLSLGTASSSLSKEDCLALLRSASGSSIGHSLAAFGSLQSAEPVLTARLGFDTWKELLGSNCLSGYTPMHAACQAGEWTNVAYLMQSMSQPPPSPSALDLAIRERQLVTYKQFNDFVQCMKTGTACCGGGESDSADAEAVALAILDRAEDCLAAASEGNEKADVSNFRLQWSAAALAATASAASSDKLSRDPILGCVQAALRDGSAAPLRGLVRGSGADCSSDLGLALQSLESQPEMLQKLALPGEHMGSSGSLGGLLGLALRRKKWRLASELLPARQFDLLPACLGIMLTLRLRPTETHANDSQMASAFSLSAERRSSCVDVELPFELCEALYKQAKHVFCTALQRLYRGAITEAQKGLVFNYLGGRFHSRDGDSGPLFCVDVIHGDGDGNGSRGRCLFDLMLLTREPELLALPCATDYVDLLLASPRSFCCHLCRNQHGDRRLEGPSCSAGPIRLIFSLWPERGEQLVRRMPRGCTPQVSMLVCTLFNAAFLCLLGFYVHEVGEPRPPGRMMFLKLLLLFCGLSYTVQEFQDVRFAKSSTPGLKSTQFCKRIAWYLTYQWNLVDIAAVVFLFVGLIWIFALDATAGSHPDITNGLSYYFARLCLALSFIFYCMRMLSSLGYFERLGLYISITKTTIVMDVIPFLIVNAFILASFGILIVCLLFPGGHTYIQGDDYDSPVRSEPLSTGRYITEVFQRPLLAHFGEFGMDSLSQCQRKPKTGQDVDQPEEYCPHPLGNKIYTRVVLFIYLLIISVVLINVLIAKLSLTVGKEDERARVIWRGFRAQLLAEFGGGGGNAAPPLFLALLWLAKAPARLWRCTTARSSSAAAAAPGGSSSAAAAVGNGNGSNNNGTATSGFAYNTANASVVSTVAAAASTGSLLSEAEKAEVGAGAGDGTGRVPSWWQIAGGNNPMAPHDFREFLWFQAMQYRSVRHRFALSSNS